MYSQRCGHRHSSRRQSILQSICTVFSVSRACTSFTLESFNDDSTGGIVCLHAHRYGWNHGSHDRPRTRTTCWYRRKVGQGLSAREDHAWSSSRYRVAARHWRESQAILPFEFHFPIHDILKVDGATNEYLIRASVQLIYQFEFLRWNSNDTSHTRFHQIDELPLSKSTLQSLWLPDIYSVDDDLISFHLEHESARISSDGRMTWTRRGLFTILSTIDLTYYPFDHQYLRITMFHRQRTFKLQYHDTRFDSNIETSLSRSSNLWSTLFHPQPRDTNDTQSSNHSTPLLSPVSSEKAILSRGWFVRVLGVEPKQENDSLDNLTVTVYLQRRREPHIYTTILPTLFLSVFIFIFYFSSIETHQRLIMTLSHILATLLFIIHLDRKVAAEQLSYSPILLKYLSMLFIIEILSLFFDHIIHSIYYGGIHFASHWLNKHTKNEDSPARLSRVTLLSPDLHPSSLDSHGPEAFLKQVIEREESTKFEDHQRQQWRKHARLSECLCCWFFLTIVIIVFLSMFFILPTLTVQNRT